MNSTLTDNPSELRYELHVDGELAGQIRYRRRPDAIVLVHTDVEPRFEGHGLGSRLVQGALDDLRARGLAVVPLCPFVAEFIRHHPDYADLVTTDTELP
jgi:predicted GNAT family acetyltransferase